MYVLYFRLRIPHDIHWHFTIVVIITHSGLGTNSEYCFTGRIDSSRNFKNSSKKSFSCRGIIDSAPQRRTSV